MEKCEDYEYIVVGCGVAGSVIARNLAERTDKKILIIEKRGHIGGNAFDYLNEKGILVQKYGPHIFHTNDKGVFDYLSRFTKWRNYFHEVVGNIHGEFLPIPFNLNSLNFAFDPDKAAHIKQKLIDVYGFGSKINILDLCRQTDADLVKVANFIYKNIFLHYTEKQWGVDPKEIDASIIGRIPLFISYDNRYFQDTYQGIPKESYATLFERMLDHNNIKLVLNCNACNLLTLKDEQIFFNGRPFGGTVIYSGAIDELFDLRFGRLPYRTLDFSFETHDTTWYQLKGTVNYPVDQKYTRITEFKHFTGQVLEGSTTIAKEYSRAYTGNDNDIPYYPIQNPESATLYKKYRKLADEFSQLYLLGRLAEYKYYNMDAVVRKALELTDSLIK